MNTENVPFTGFYLPARIVDGVIVATITAAQLRERQIRDEIRRLTGDMK